MNDIETIKEKLKIIESLCTDDCISKPNVIEPLKYAIENLINRVKKLQEENNELKEQITYLTSTNNKDILKYWRKK